MDDDKKQPQGSLNEGEGSKTADKQYRQGATDFAKRTDTLQKGIEAEREVENYRDEYERAEKSGRCTAPGTSRATWKEKATPAASAAPRLSLRGPPLYPRRPPPGPGVRSRNRCQSIRYFRTL